MYAFYSSYDTEAVEVRLQKLVTKASSIILSNITLDALDDLDEIEVCLSCFANFYLHSNKEIFSFVIGVP